MHQLRSRLIDQDGHCPVGSPVDCPAKDGESGCLAEAWEL